MAEGAGFEPARPCGRWISSPLPYLLGLTLRACAVKSPWFMVDPARRPILISNFGRQMQEKSCNRSRLSQDKGSKSFRCLCFFGTDQEMLEELKE